MITDKVIIIFAKTFVLLLASLVSVYLIFGEDIIFHFKKKAALDNIASQFYDPKTVEFRNIRFDNEILICGEVNGKNMHGAYVGFKRFYALVSDVKEKLMVTIEDTDDFSNNMINSMCKDKK